MGKLENKVALVTGAATGIGRATAITLAKEGSIDLAVNNAGIGGTGAALHEQTLEDWQLMMNINLTGVFVCLQKEIHLTLMDIAFVWMEVLNRVKYNPQSLKSNVIDIRNLREIRNHTSKIIHPYSLYSCYKDL